MHYKNKKSTVKLLFKGCKCFIKVDGGSNCLTNHDARQQRRGLQRHCIPESLAVDRLMAARARNCQFKSSILSSSPQSERRIIHAHHANIKHIERQR